MTFAYVVKGFGWMLVGFVLGGLFGALLGYVFASTVLCDFGFEFALFCDEIRQLAALGGAAVFSFMAGIVCGVVGGVTGSLQVARTVPQSSQTSQQPERQNTPTTSQTERSQPSAPPSVNSTDIGVSNANPSTGEFITLTASSTGALSSGRPYMYQRKSPEDTDWRNLGTHRAEDTLAVFSDVPITYAYRAIVTESDGTSVASGAVSVTWSASET